MSLTSLMFMAIYQAGFRFETRLGQDIKAILVSELGIEPEFVDKRIATIFINGKAVDDLETARVTDGCVLTLSGAMPGLVGACLRKSGRYASLRSGISYSPEPQTRSSETGVITVKLFNTLITELGPSFLQRGIIVDDRQYQGLMADINKSSKKSSLFDLLHFEKYGSDSYKISIA